ncbi:MAG: efflux RND transporter periplasmic adaptor subunit [Nibricoccus sp.]
MRPKTKAIVFGVIGLAATGGWFGYRMVLTEAPVTHVTRGTAIQAVPANVVVLPESTMPISSEQGGRVLKRLVKKGQDVKAGDLLFEIDPTDLQLEIERIEIERDAFEARLKLGSPSRFELSSAEENLKKNNRLFETGRLSQIEFDQIKRQVDVLKDRIANEEITNKQTSANYANTLKQKYRARDKMKVIAPADGTVIELNAEPGMLVGGGHVLAQVISRARRVEAQISEENISGVRAGLPVAVYFLGLYGERFTGKVDSVIASADERTKRYTAYLSLNIAEERLAPGLTGEASITINQRENSLKVERRSLVANKLYLVRDGRVKITPVEIGFTNQKSAEILSGANEGDAYIVDDVSNFRDGQRVRVVSASK